MEGGLALAAGVRGIRGEAFEEEVLRSGLPVVVDFCAGSCPPCEAVSPIIEELAAEFEGRVKFVRLNMDDDEDQSQRLAARFALASVPTVLYFSDGTLRGRTVGAAARTEFRQGVQSLVDTPRANGEGLGDTCTPAALGESYRQSIASALLRVGWAWGPL